MPSAMRIDVAAHATLRHVLVAWFAATAFVGAAMLFWIQPLFAKMVLPVLGGSSAVWSTAMVFFQAGRCSGATPMRIFWRGCGPGFR